MKLSKIVVTISVTLLAYTAIIPSTWAATKEEKSTAIRLGLARLYATQQTGGYWEFSGFEQAATGAAVSAFIGQQDRWGLQATEYQVAVDQAIAYLLSTASTTEISIRNDDVNVCPGRAGSCKGIYWFGNSKSTFTTGVVATAIAAYGLTKGSDTVATSTGPLAGMTWKDIAQAITNGIAASQSTVANGNRAGGWSYLIPGNGDSDSLSTTSAVMALMYDEALGAITPQVLKDELKVWLGKVQNASGAVCDYPYADPCGASNTGGWVLGMKFVGFDVNDSSLAAAIASLNQDLDADANAPVQIFRDVPRMWSVYHGLATTVSLNDRTQIRTLECTAIEEGSTAQPSGDIPCTSVEKFHTGMLRNQKADGSWGAADSGNSLATGLAVSILGSLNISLGASRSSISSSQGGETSPKLQSTAAFTSVGSSGAISSMAPAQAAPLKKLRKRDRKGVTALAVSVDGGSLATASSDKKVTVWNPTTGVARVSLQGFSGVPTGIAFSRGGDTISSVGKDSFIRQWDTASGRELAKVAGHEQGIRAVAASPDGTLLASVGEETRVMVWDQTTRKLNKILFGPKDFVNAVAFSPDSRVLATAGEDTRVQLFDVTTGKLLFTLLGHAGALDTVAFSPSGTVLASAGQDTVIRLWDAANGLQRQALSGHSAPIRTVAFSPNGRVVASGGEDTQIKLWNVATGALERSLTGSTGAINAIVFDPKGLFLASGTESGDITVWNVTTGARLLTFTLPKT